MVDDARRRQLFWCVCVPVRIAIGAGVFALGTAYPDVLRLMSVLALAPVVTWSVYILRPKQTGFFGGVAWWSGIRWVHAMLWSVVFVSALLRSRLAGLALLADVSFGVVAALWNGR